VTETDQAILAESASREILRITFEQPVAAGLEQGLPLDAIAVLCIQVSEGAELWTAVAKRLAPDRERDMIDRALAQGRSPVLMIGTERARLADALGDFSDVARTCRKGPPPGEVFVVDCGTKSGRRVVSIASFSVDVTTREEAPS
jgi:hypothetical protein